MTNQVNSNNNDDLIKSLQRLLFNQFDRMIKANNSMDFYREQLHKNVDNSDAIDKHLKASKDYDRSQKNIDFIKFMIDLKKFIDDKEKKGG